MIEAYGKQNIRAFTIALNENHPDYIYSNKIARHFGIDHEIFVPYSKPERCKYDYPGDEIVRLFYENLVLKNIKKIICCDGIDEFNCGYYDHQKYLDENTYYYFLTKLKKEQLEPLNRNSKNINVYLPYIDERLILLFSQIPLKNKVDSNFRKKIVLKMAKDKIPDEIIRRRKYGFCDAMKIKK